MLTSGDRTVEDCLNVVDEALAVGLQHIGFKDVGVKAATLRALNGRIKDAGATSYMEVVSTSPSAALRSASVAALSLSVKDQAMPAARTSTPF